MVYFKPGRVEVRDFWKKVFCEKYNREKRDMIRKKISEGHSAEAAYAHVFGLEIRDYSIYRY